MKKSILLITASTLLTGAILSSCNTPAEKVESAETTVTEAKENLVQANEEYLEDIKSYKTTTDEKIQANEKSIAEFEERIAHEKKEAKANYKKKIAELNQKNTDMKKRMDDYSADGKENWEKFKAEFSHDMDELGTAFKDLTVKNVK